MRLGNTSIEFEETKERMKVEIPLKRNKIALFAYVCLFTLWLGFLFLFFATLFRPANGGFIAGLPTSIQVVWVMGVALWIYVWIRYLGRKLWRWLQFNLANREILFIDDNMIIVRRPVSLLGLTDAYDRRFISPFYYSEQHEALAFPYGNVQHILVALSLAKAEQMELLRFLNNRFFPGASDDDDDDDED